MFSVVNAARRYGSLARDKERERCARIVEDEMRRHRAEAHVAERESPERDEEAMLERAMEQALATAAKLIREETT